MMKKTMGRTRLEILKVHETAHRCAIPVIQNSGVALWSDADALQIRRFLDDALPCAVGESAANEKQDHKEEKQCAEHNGNGVMPGALLARLSVIDIRIYFFFS